MKTIMFLLTLVNANEYITKKELIEIHKSQLKKYRTMKYAECLRLFPNPIKKYRCFLKYGKEIERELPRTIPRTLDEINL